MMRAALLLLPSLAACPSPPPYSLDGNGMKATVSVRAQGETSLGETREKVRTVVAVAFDEPLMSVLCPDAGSDQLDVYAGPVGAARKLDTLCNPPKEGELESLLLSLRSRPDGYVAAGVFTGWSDAYEVTIVHRASGTRLADRAVAPAPHWFELSLTPRVLLAGQGAHLHWDVSDQPYTVADVQSKDWYEPSNEVLALDAPDDGWEPVGVGVMDHVSELFTSVTRKTRPPAQPPGLAFDLRLTRVLRRLPNQ